MTASGKRILVLDDDKLVLRSVGRALERAGYDVLTAQDVSSAMELSTRGPVDAAIVDYALSRENGLTALSRLRELQPTCLRVLMTGYSDTTVVVEAVNRGEVVRVVRKPFEVHDLLRLLEEAFESAQRLEKAATEKLIAKAMRERQGLDEVLEGGRFDLALQPIVRINNGDHGDNGNPGVATVVAYEALLRPHHPDFHDPMSLLQAAERYSRVHDLGGHLLAVGARLLDQIPARCKLFLNLHPAQLGDPARLGQDLLPLAPHADRVVLEITERSRLQDIRQWEESVRRMIEAGFALAIDDLGAGYSSLTMLADLNPRYIKLDMSLVRNIDREPRKQRLVHLMSTFGDATQADVIAEGVETQEESEVLLRSGVDLLQGYLYGRPEIVAEVG